MFKIDRTYTLRKADARLKLNGDSKDNIGGQKQ